MRLIVATLTLALCAVAPTHAAGDPTDSPPDDLDALSLADKAPADAAQSAKSWRLFVEGAVGRGKLRATDSNFSLYRGSLDFRFDDHLAPQLRAVFSDRLDGVDSDGVPPGDNVNTLREAYLSWSRTDDQIFDLGRVNIRNGAAMGFNPTDWFKANALRSIVNPDPVVLRENRQGTVVLQAQQLWSEASLTAAISPRLARSADSATFALNAGATNPSNRYLVAGSYKFGDKFNPQLLVYGGDDNPAQVGLNMSGVFGDALVAYGEVSAGKGISLVAQALALPERQRSQQRASVGLTYTTSFNLSVTAEAEYNSAAPNGDEWHLLPGAAQQQVLSTAQALQDLPTRNQWFLYAAWKDLLVKRLDVLGFLRQDMQTSSRSMWLEGRYSWERAELALQWQFYSGSPGSVFYAVPQQQLVQLALRLYL
jgi:hypothetical protein